MSDEAVWLGSMPEVYDRVLVPALFAPFADRLAEAAAALRPVAVLELAAGTGAATAALVRALPDARIVATDLNDAMVAWSQQRVPGAQWQQADAQSLDLPDDSFDLVACQFGAMFFPDRPGAYAEAARVLRPDGALLLLIWDDVQDADFPRALVESIDAVIPEDPPTFVARVPHGYTDTALIESDLRAGGFGEVGFDRLTLTGTAPSAAALAEGFCWGTPLRFALEQRGPLDELTAAIGVEMTTRLGPGLLTGEAAAFLVTARR